MNRPPRDTIALAEFSWEVRQGLEKISCDYQLYFPDLAHQYDPSTWAGLFFILTQVPDQPEYFPRGKWATIQHLEKLLWEWGQAQVKPKSLG